VLLVEQNLYSALAVADRVTVMESGRAVFEGGAAEVTRDPDSLIRFLGVH
jgi:branched-chain amino acid transport system ATP-binding protein